MIGRDCLQVPNLYEGGDLGAIAEGVRPRAKKQKRDGSRLELLAFFVDECNKNLRIALVSPPPCCFSNKWTIV
jgi:dynein heavy chain